jgi:pectinesterase
MQGTTINSVAKGLGTITAQGREDASDDSGFVFIHCKIQGTGDTYLGRAWRKMPRVVFAYTEMGSLIDKEGWSDNAGGQTSDSEYICLLPNLINLHFSLLLLLLLLLLINCDDG